VIRPKKGSIFPVKGIALLPGREAGKKRASHTRSENPHINQLQTTALVTRVLEVGEGE